MFEFCGRDPGEFTFGTFISSPLDKVSHLVFVLLVKLGVGSLEILYLGLLLTLTRGGAGWVQFRMVFGVVGLRMEM